MAWIGNHISSYLWKVKQFWEDKRPSKVTELQWNSLGHALQAAGITAVIALPAEAAVLIVVSFATFKEVNDKGTLQKKIIDVGAWTLGSLLTVGLLRLI